MLGLTKSATTSAINTANSNKRNAHKVMPTQQAGGTATLTRAKPHYRKANLRTGQKTKQTNTDKPTELQIHSNTDSTQSKQTDWTTDWLKKANSNKRRHFSRSADIARNVKQSQQTTQDEQKNTEKHKTSRQEQTTEQHTTHPKMKSGTRSNCQTP